MSRALFRGFAPTYDTPLSDRQAKDYRGWRARLPQDLQNTEDYDLQGAFLAAMQANGRMHMGDQFKKPNHMTFSDQSQYSSPAMRGGHWGDTGLANPSNPQENRQVFWASPQNMTQHSIPEMQRYFSEAEPGSTPVFDIPYWLKAGRN